MRQLNSLLGVLPLGARQGDEAASARRLLRRGRAAIGVVGQIGDDLLHAGGAGFGIADQDLLAAGAFCLGGDTVRRRSSNR